MNQAITDLINYGLGTGLLAEEDQIYATNMILDALRLPGFEAAIEGTAKSGEEDLEGILKTLLDYAVEQGIIEEGTVSRDLFDTRLMNFLMPRPSEVVKRFYEFYQVSPELATADYYRFSQDSDYIRRYRVKKDLKWQVDTEYGALDITINLSKPEKDPKAIAAAKTAGQSGYPKCLLCKENEGYAGSLSHPARQNHRIIPVEIQGKQWGFQYSPYVYYNEHCIVFSEEHVPMQINAETFTKLFGFIKLFPHYILGSNADLPIVGGSILSHDHFQGGNYLFPMAMAEIEEEVIIHGFEHVKAGIVKWPMSVLRLCHEDEQELVKLGSRVLNAWRRYSDESLFIFAETGGEPHNTITPIARKRDGVYELDLVLRNNITTAEHPLGVYHPHEELHHIKKENIGLIEVLGLAILPPRLKAELELLAECLMTGREVETDARIAGHGEWIRAIRAKYPDIQNMDAFEVLRQEVGLVFLEVLSHAGVYKRDEAGKAGFIRFLKTV